MQLFLKCVCRKMLREVSVAKFEKYSVLYWKNLRDIRLVSVWTIPVH